MTTETNNKTSKATEKKFELTDETFYDYHVDARVYRIKALRDFGDVKAGDLGGFVEEESNLSHESTCWIYDNAVVCKGSEVSDEAEVRGSAVVSDKSYVWEDARIYENARVYNSLIKGGVVHGNAVVNNAEVFWHAEVKDEANIREGQIRDGATISENAVVSGFSCIYGYDTVVGSNAHIANGDVGCTDDWHVFGGYRGHYVTWLREEDGFVLFGRKYGANELIEYAHECGGFVLANAISALAGVEAIKLQTKSNRQDNDEE